MSFRLRLVQSFRFQFASAEASAARRTTSMNGERQRAPSFLGGCRVMWAAVLATMVAVSSSAQSPSIAIGPLQRCIALDGKLACRRIAIEQLDLHGPAVQVRQIVKVAPSIMASQLPLAVTLVGTMSAEVRWNGTLIGHNGVVGGDTASETPGRFHATFPVPHEIVILGRNVVDVRMSAHHRWLPVSMPVQQIGVGLYEGWSTGELRTYWPALLTAGALILAALYFGTTAVVGRDRRNALILASAGTCAALQLVVETSRSFLDYPYTWHIARIAAIVLLAALTSALMAAYAARRYVPQSTRRIVSSSVVISIAATTLLPQFDAKAWACLFATGIICLLCAANARQRRDRRIGMIVASLFALMLLGWRGDALDRGYYLFIAALLATLVAEQVFGLRHLYSGLTTERERNESLSLRLTAAEAADTSIVSFRDGSAIHRVPEEDIVRITAADDFCELTLTNRRPLLVGGTLKALAASLPDQFLRVHKSYIVNLAHVAAVNPKPGGGYQLRFNDGSSTPIGRTYRDVVLARLQCGDAGAADPLAGGLMPHVTTVRDCWKRRG